MSLEKPMKKSLFATLALAALCSSAPCALYALPCTGICRAARTMRLWRRRRKHTWTSSGGVAGLKPTSRRSLAGQLRPLEMV
jgi:hypothetical protein